MQEFFEKVRKDGKKQKRWLRGYRRGGRWINVGKRGVILVREFDGVWDLMGTLFHWQIMGFLWIFTGKFLLSLLIQLGFHGFFWIVGATMSKVNGRKLDLLQAEYSEYRNQYLHQRRVQFGFDNYWRSHYEDGSLVGTSFVAAPMEQSVGDIQIFQLDKIDDYLAYHDQAASYPQTVTINQRFGSMAFKKKIALALCDTTEMEGMKYMTPTKQLALVQSEALGHFERIHVEGKQLSAKVKNVVESPRGVDVYQKRELMDCFREADRYCQQLRSWADETHRNLEKISFLRGA